MAANSIVGASGSGATSEGRKRFVFVFPMASGHLNPSLPISRSLVEAGHEVHYACCEQMRHAIEGTGATLHLDRDLESELYEGRAPDYQQALLDLQREHGLSDENAFLAMFKIRSIVLELQLPGLLRFLREVQPSAIVFCPLANREAAAAARILNVPAVPLLTTAGPGSCHSFMKELLATMGKTPDDLAADVNSFGPSAAAAERLRAQYGLIVSGLDFIEPLGGLESVLHAPVTLVTTSEDLQDPMPEELESFYASKGVQFAALGPLLDRAGASRAGGHKFKQEIGEASAETKTEISSEGTPISDAGIVERVCAAKAVGRQVVFASMGTVVTGDHHEWGWDGRTKGPDGQPRGLTGRELCQAAWGAVFDVFGSAASEEGALVVVSLGPQKDPLGGLDVPPNAICAPFVPQVDVLKAGVDLFLTHGGQNSFTEALASSVPLVVCPGFADQPVNAQKAERIGVGLKVDRPVPQAGEEAAAVAAFRAETGSALRTVAEEPAFREAAAECAERLRRAGGVPRAVELVLAAAATGAPAATCATEVDADQKGKALVPEQHDTTGLLGGQGGA